MTVLAPFGGALLLCTLVSCRPEASLIEAFVKKLDERTVITTFLCWEKGKNPQHTLKVTQGRCSFQPICTDSN